MLIDVAELKEKAVTIANSNLLYYVLLSYDFMFINSNE